MKYFGYLILAIAPRPAVVTLISTKPTRIVVLAPIIFLSKPLNGEKIIYETEKTAIIRLVSFDSRV